MNNAARGIVVIGVGNVIMSDDALGVHAVRSLLRRLPQRLRRRASVREKPRVFWG